MFLRAFERPDIKCNIHNGTFRPFLVIFCSVCYCDHYLTIVNHYIRKTGMRKDEAAIHEYTEKFRELKEKEWPRDGAYLRVRV